MCLILIPARYTSSHIQRKIRLCSNDLTPFHKLISTEIIELGAIPRKLWSVFREKTQIG